MPESAKQVLHELTAAGLLSSAEVTKFEDEINVGVDALLDRLVADQRITDYQAQKFREGQSSDIYFGDYIVLEELGRGGMGTVLLARHRRMDREVAIKILPVTALESESAVARFYQEVKVAAQLTHPNIVHAYDAGEHHGFHYLVMEYVKGHDLARVLEHMGPVPLTLALDYLLQTAQGLEYAHRKGVVHRDIKPSNLLLDDEGKVKILDMGLARLGKGFGGADVSMHLTTTGQVMGTVEYMSPEQAEDTRLADERSDIYSLGCTLYRLVTGLAPFARDTMVKTILAHREAEIPAMPVNQFPELAQLDPLFRSMVAKNPDNRIQTVTLLVQELKRLIDGGDISIASSAASSDIEVVRRGTTEWGSTKKSDNETKRKEIEYMSEVTAATPISSSFDSPTIERPAVHLSNPYVAPAAPISGAMQQQVVLKGKSHRGMRLIGSGVLSILFAFCGFGIVGLPIAIVTIICSNNDLAEMGTGLRNPAGTTLTKTARILAMIGCGISGLRILIGMFGN